MSAHQTTHILRDIKPSDIASIYQGLSDPRVTRYYGVHFNSLQHTREQMDWYAQIERTQSGKWWAICTNPAGEFQGACGYNNWNHKTQAAEIGFWLLPGSWGRGIITNVLPDVLKIGARTMRLNTVHAVVETENVNCISVLKKMQFVPNGNIHVEEKHDGTMVQVETWTIKL